MDIGCEGVRIVFEFLIKYVCCFLFQHCVGRVNYAGRRNDVFRSRITFENQLIHCTLNECVWELFLLLKTGDQLLYNLDGLARSKEVFAATHNRSENVIFPQ
jgi:hypothetical protein